VIGTVRWDMLKPLPLTIVHKPSGPGAFTEANPRIFGG
jgi:hypothetical protein